MLIHAQIFYVSDVKIGIYFIVKIFIEISGKNQYFTRKQRVHFAVQYNVIITSSFVWFRNDIWNMHGYES